MERMIKMEKFGSCSNSSSTHGLDGICIDTCDGLDYRCPGQYKCCSHTCGRTCQDPQDLFALSDTILPPIPKSITLTSLDDHRNGRRTAEISWKMDWRTKPISRSVYVVEAQAHTGHIFFEHKLSNWFNINIDITSSSRTNYSPGQDKSTITLAIFFLNSLNNKMILNKMFRPFHLLITGLVET